MVGLWLETNRKIQKIQAEFKRLVEEDQKKKEFSLAKLF